MTDGKAKTNNRVAADLVVCWCEAGRLQVSNSRHTGWYTLVVDEQGQLACPCPDATYRPYRTCKHVWAAAQYLETHSPVTTGQRNVAQATIRDHTRAILRLTDASRNDPEMDDYDPGSGPRAAGGAQVLKRPEDPEQPECTVTTANARLEDLFE